MILKKILVAGLLTTLSSTLFAADAKEEVTKAAQALGEKANYSWKTTVELPERAQSRRGGTEGKTDKDGTIYLTMNFRDNTTQAVIQGEKAAFTNREGEWMSASEAADGQGGGRFMARMLRNSRTPAKEAAELAKAVKELTKEGDAYVGELTEEGAKGFLRFRGRSGGDGPEIKGAKGSAKFWLKDGVLAKYEHQVQGQMNFNGNDVNIDRTTTTEIKEVGTTKVMIPEAAKKKLS